MTADHELALREFPRPRRYVLLVLVASGLAFALALVVAFWFLRSHTVEHGYVAFDLSPDDRSIAFTAAGGDLFLLDLEAQNVRQLTTTGRVATSPAFSPDGQTIIYAGDDDEGSGMALFACSLDGQRVERLTRSSGVSDSLPRYSPDGSRIVFARAHRHRPYSMGGWTWDDYDLYVMDADGKNQRRLTERKHYWISGVAVSGDRKTAFYSAETERNSPDLTVTVFKVPLDGSLRPRPLTTPPGASRPPYAWATDPALSPDGAQLAFISDRDEPFHYDVLLMDMQTREARSLGATAVSGHNGNLVFSADGQTLYFLAGTESNRFSRPIYSLWSIDVDSGATTPIARSDLFTDSMTWSPLP